MVAPPTAAQLGSSLVHRSLLRARARGAHQLLITLDPSEPAAWAVLEALREAVGTDVEQVVTRAAGGSVLVDVDLRTPLGPPRASGRATAADDAWSAEPDGFGTDPATGFLVLAR